MTSSSREPRPEDRPSVARMYDYFLGGYHNFAVDRAAADQMAALEPEFPLYLRANRAFLRRAVSFMLRSGVRQLLDLGSGIPTVGNVHEVAEAIAPETRVVYVDIDPIAVALGRDVLADNPRATVIQGDMLQTDSVLSHPELERLIYPSEPMGVLLLAVVHFIADDSVAERFVRDVRERMAPGSYLALTHATQSFQPQAMEGLLSEYARASSPVTLRTGEQIATFFDGLELVEPGLVPTPAWRPESKDDLFVDEPKRAHAFAGVGRKPKT
jgi:S-adenosyl methyltransferase